MELGNAMFGNSRGEHPVDRSLQELFQTEILYALGMDGYGEFREKLPEGWTELSPVGHTNGVYTVRPYFWGDCSEECVSADLPDHECIPTCPCVLPNFEHHPSGFTLKWYKYSLRDSYSSAPLTAELIMAMSPSPALDNKEVGG